MQLEPNEDKLRILLCKADFDAYLQMKDVPKLTSLLTTTLVLPALMEAIAILDGNDVPDTKWANRLQARLDSENLGSGRTSLERAQSLLNLPIRRALASALMYSDSKTP